MVSCLMYYEFRVSSKESIYMAQTSRGCVWLGVGDVQGIQCSP
jgi:hypothetical protein